MVGRRDVVGRMGVVGRRGVVRYSKNETMNSIHYGF